MGQRAQCREIRTEVRHARVAVKPELARILEILARAAPADRPFLEPRRVPAWAAASPAPPDARRAHPGAESGFSRIGG